MSVTSTANVNPFSVVKSNVGVDTSFFNAFEIICDTLVAEHIDAPSGGKIDLEGYVGINVDASLQGVTTIAGAPATEQKIYIGGNDGVTTVAGWGANTGLKNVYIAGSTGANVVQIANNQTAGSLTVGAALTTGTIAIGNASATTGTVTINGGTAGAFVTGHKRTVVIASATPLTAAQSGALILVTGAFAITLPATAIVGTYFEILIQTASAITIVTTGNTLTGNFRTVANTTNTAVNTNASGTTTTISAAAARAGSKILYVWTGAVGAASTTVTVSGDLSSNAITDLPTFA